MLCFFWLEDCPGHSRLCSAVGLRRVLAGLVCVPPKPRLASWAEREELPVPSGGKGSWEKRGVVPVPRLSASPEDSQPGRWPDGPFLTCLLLFCSGPEPGVVSGTRCPSLAGRAGGLGERGLE